MYSLFFFVMGSLTIITQQSGSIFLTHLVQNFFLYSSLGMAWNIMSGLCGYYSFGHGLYMGIGAYLNIFFLIHYPQYFFITIPLILLFITVLSYSVFSLTLKLKIEHAYFTLLSICFLETGRILFENLAIFGQTNGLFLKALPYQCFIDEYFVYIMFFVMLFIFILSFYVFQSDVALEGKALADNKNTALSIGIHPYKSPLFMMILSCVLTALIGIIYSLYQKNLFPEDVFSQQRSMHIILAPIIGGVGFLFGPLVGSFVLICFDEFIEIVMIDFFEIDFPGMKYVCFGMILLFTILKMPQGILYKILSRSL